MQFDADVSHLLQLPLHAEQAKLSKNTFPVVHSHTPLLLVQGEVQVVHQSDSLHSEQLDGEHSWLQAIGKTPI